MGQATLVFTPISFPDEYNARRGVMSMAWREQIRNLWIERMIWIRHYIISLMMGLRDLSFVATRVLRNGTDFARSLSRLYGPAAATQFENLLTRHILTLSEMASTMKMSGSMEVLKANWRISYSEFIDFANSINPYWDKSTWTEIIEDQVEIELDLLTKLYETKYAEGISNFDAAHDNALKMARAMIDGIERHLQITD